MSFRTRLLVLAVVGAWCFRTDAALDTVFAKWVPIEQVAGNLLQQIQNQPKNGELRAQLGRAYSIWFAKGLYEVAPKMSISTNDAHSAEQVVLRDFRREAREFMKPWETTQKIPTLQIKLRKAIFHYEKAIELGQTNALVYLGLGWIQYQGGQTNAARENFRKALKLAENSKTLAEYGHDLELTSEIIAYLMPLLNVTDNPEELNELEKKRRAAMFRHMQRPVTPIMIPLNPGISRLADLLDWNARVVFDLDGTEKKEWQWITPDAAWLVYQNEPGEAIESGIQMFGSVTFWIFWRNGYCALATLDDDDNGYLEGAELRNLSLWQDRDSDGVSDPSEVWPIEMFGIVRLSTKYRAVGSGTYVSDEGAIFSDGTTRATYDISLLSHAE